MNLDKESRQIFQDSAREWLVDNASITHFRAQRDKQSCVSGHESWQEMAALGWPGIMVPEDLGGSGLGITELGLIIEQAGHHLCASPLLSTGLIAVSALTLCQQTDYSQAKLRAIALGELKVALALEENHHHNPQAVSAVAKQHADGWLLSGEKIHVAEAGSADALLISARTEDSNRLGLFLVSAENIEIKPLQLIDSRDHANIAFDNISVPADALLELGDESCALLDKVLDRACIGLAAEMLGTATAAFEMTLEYLKIREQFGQIIGSYQALQHRAAKMYIEIELARSVVEKALQAVDEDSPEVAVLASQAKALMGDTLQHITNETIQLHGGIGMTDEHDAGLFIKRARVTEYLYGSSAYHRDRFATLRGF
ncbi:acyl-CoA dehydrogenase [Pseudomaricurvus alkylphenolicus]|uniref:acyl-CoA dehydrogenase family protein n=1 Tax=Pseudomaricurvus alkylphenolicus TaxID=1306991 RepID=UPI0014249B59|nr:acyl-CoA dehydrogenase family protein [Pseudomaricurvus alkylphenolicus]NIB44986.1 acyl-CoA dehydrogenase [Pseudomaricurvus alkylphenolicus]